MRAIKCLYGTILPGRPAEPDDLEYVKSLNRALNEEIDETRLRKIMEIVGPLTRSFGYVIRDIVPTNTILEEKLIEKAYVVVYFKNNHSLKINSCRRSKPYEWVWGLPTHARLFLGGEWSNKEIYLEVSDTFELDNKYIVALKTIASSPVPSTKKEKSKTQAKPPPSELNVKIMARFVRTAEIRELCAKLATDPAPPSAKGPSGHK